jgi:DNA-binding NarL/FixJ family response regulator
MKEDTTGDSLPSGITTKGLASKPPDIGYRDALEASEGADKQPIAVVTAYLGTITGRGVIDVLREHEGFRLVASDVGVCDLRLTVAHHLPLVAIIGDTYMNPIEVLQQLLAAESSVACLVLAHGSNRAGERQLLAAGAAACIASNATTADLLELVHRAATGRRTLTDVSGRVAGSARAEPVALTRRERDVLELLRLELSDAEIAQRLYVSLATVRTHARNIYRKLGVSGRRELWIFNC